MRDGLQKPNRAEEVFNARQEKKSNSNWQQDPGKQFLLKSESQEKIQEAKDSDELGKASKVSGEGWLSRAGS